VTDARCGWWAVAPIDPPPRRSFEAASSRSDRAILVSSSEVAAISSLTSAAPLAIVIFLVTIGLVIVRPHGLTEARAAFLGAAVMVLAGLVSAGNAASNVVGHWNVLLFFVGRTGAAAVAERSGLFEAVAGTSARVSDSWSTTPRCRSCWFDVRPDDRSARHCPPCGSRHA
jgi:di/tricarboxylate transporter